MDVFSVFGVACVTSLLAVTLKQFRPEMALEASIAGGVIMLLMIVSNIGDAAKTVKSILHESGIDNSLIDTILKLVGIAYISQTAAELCRDAGEGALAYRTELCGRVLMLTCALPAILELVGILLKLTDMIG